MTIQMILTPEEKRIFTSVPIFTARERKKYFSFPQRMLEIANTLTTSQNKAYFLLLYGYFKATNKFSGHGFHAKDIAFVAGKLGISSEDIFGKPYKRRTFLNHRDRILSYCGVRKFTAQSSSSFLPQLAPLIHAQTRPSTIFFHTCELLIKQKIEIPAYNTLAILIAGELRRCQKEIIHTLNTSLTHDNKQLLDNLLQKEDLEKAPSHRYKLTLIKKFTQSTKPTKVKENITDLAIVQKLFDSFSLAVEKCQFTAEAIKYYAHCVLKFKMLQMLRRSDKERYLYLFSFIVHQYYSGQDVLIDILLLAVQSSLNKVVLDHKENIFAMRKTKTDAIEQIVTITKTQKELMMHIQKVLQDATLTNEEKVQQLQLLFANHKKQEVPSEKVIQALEKETARLTKDEDYYDILEAQSVRLQNRVSDIVKVITFDAANANKDIMEAIRFYKQHDGNITQAAPIDFLDEREQTVVFDSKGKLRVSLYKALLFVHIASLIKSGGLNLIHSYKYKAFEAYLLPADRSSFYLMTGLSVGF